MQEMYAECFVKGGQKSQYKVLIPVLVIAAAALFFLLNQLIPLFGWIIGLIPFAGIYYLANNSKVDYEYVFVTDELQIDKIINGNKRKRVITLQMSDTERVAPMSSHEFDGQMGNKNMKIHDYTSGKKTATVYGMLSKDTDGKTALFLLELNSPVLNLMRLIAPRKVML